MGKGKKRVALGSGSMYTMQFDEEIPEDSVIEVLNHNIGVIQGGASLEYKAEYYTAEDDLGLVKKTILTKEDVLFKSGVMTWNGESFPIICATARVTDNVETGIRTVKIGGAGNQDGKRYLIRFVQKDAQDGDCRITIVGKNEAGFTIAFSKDKETIIDTEFKAEPLDDDGTLIIYTESLPVDQLLTLTSIAGATTGKTKITVTPAKATGNSYLYETAKIVTPPRIGDDCTTGYTTWDGIVDITAITGNEIGIIEVNTQHKAVKVGKIKVVSKV